MDVAYLKQHMKTTQVAVETLKASGEKLVDWVAEKYGYPVSYTRAESASHITLKVDGGGEPIYIHRVRFVQFRAV